jgi:hypothetical protein
VVILRSIAFRSVALAVAATALAVPSAYAGPATVDQTDPTGDVNVLDGGGGKPTTAQRLTIDLERFSAIRTPAGLELSFRIARITGSRSFDQVVEAQLQRTGRDGFVMDVAASPQHQNATAYLDDTICVGDVRTSRRSSTVRVTVPAACVPAGSGVLRVITYTQKRNGSGPGFSEDTMRVKGQVTF